MNQDTLNRQLNQILGILLGLGIACWILRGLGIFTFIPGGVIVLFFFGAIGVGVLNYVKYKWWRF